MHRKKETINKHVTPSLQTKQDPFQTLKTDFIP